MIRVKPAFILFCLQIFLGHFSLFAGQDSEIKAVLDQLEPVKEEQPVVNRKVLEYRASNLRDPFEEVIQEAVTAEIQPNQESDTQENVEVKPMPVFTVQGIIWGGKLPQAIINNIVVAKGDIIAEAQVVDIRKEGIVITFYGRTVILRQPATP